MKRTFANIFLVLICCQLYSQSITPYVVSTRGGYFSNSTSSLSWTLGQLASTSLMATNNILTQGFQQPYYFDPFNIPVALTDSFDIKVYPNPAVDHVNIAYSTLQEGKIKFELFDLLGNKLMPDIEKYSGISKRVFELNLSNFDSGIYLLRILSEKTRIINTHKIVKIE